ncbi:DUF1659 domain-containing protein [uncultured Dialister sp.]|jgi:hypothetical protein|uniref:DUF1659 domain-containing protein n=1 Tax=Dialister sp. TaxID=1955814 RepID=UPI0025EE016F|nr:DUF1659 domain-containing protein [uncultured Dialister sp.]
MAAVKAISDVKLQVRFNNGTTASGKAAVKTVTLSQVKLDATDQQLLDAGNALAGLSSLTLNGVRRVDTGDLSDGAGA